MNGLHSRCRKPARNALVLGFGLAGPERPVAGLASVGTGRGHGLARNLDSSNDLPGKIRKWYLLTLLPCRHERPAPKAHHGIGGSEPGSQQLTRFGPIRDYKGEVLRGSVENTLSRIKRATGVKIAKRLVKLHGDLGAHLNHNAEP